MIARMADGPRSQVFAAGLLSGQVALVTGGGTGLGRATAIELARCGAHVVIAGRRAEVLEATAAEIREAVGQRAVGREVSGRKGVEQEAVGQEAIGEEEIGREAVQGETVGRNAVGEETVGRGAIGEGLVDWVAGDVRDRDDARRLVVATDERHGRLDILVNNAGGQYFTPAEAIVVKGWRAVWRLNVEGMLNMAYAAVEHGLGAGVAGAPGGPGEGERRGVAQAGELGAIADGPIGPIVNGTIVNVTLSPHHGMPGMAHSGAARATVEALTRELAERWADRGIAVTAIAAGHFDTEAMAKYPDTVRAGMARSVPLQRLGRPQEHAWLVALLCSPLGRALNGSTITLDGARDNWFGPWPPPGLTGATGEVPTEARRGCGRREGHGRAVRAADGN